ncbi:MAG TPA: L,D-transpeptidase family protein [Prolixibacteraceae bacterium]|nr:L,D-transpeptidase family protein [Prolixibacteraceae bacterium]
MTKIKDRSLITFLLVICLALNGYTQNSQTKEDLQAKQDSILLAKFYETARKPVYWFSSPKNIKRANEWLTTLESRAVKLMGFEVNNMQTDQLQAVLKQGKKLDNTRKQKADKQITALVLRFIKFLHQGEVPLKYDAISENRDSAYVSQLLESQNNGSVETTILQLDSNDRDYLKLKKYLEDSVSDKASVMAKKIYLTMNYMRFLSANSSKEQIIVNIPEAHAIYYRDKLPTVDMRVVPGTKDDPTPTMASYITSIITFPPWKVPQRIAVDEILPEVQKDEKYLKEKKFIVVYSKENEVDRKDLKWEEYDKDNFPYFFQQQPGPDNSLGVIKFNLKNPLSIYLHATNWHGAFEQDSRFLSHGCVRLEKPYQLANAILRGEIGREELAKVRDNIETKEYTIKRKIPTFLVYMPAVVNGNKVTLLNDIYSLIQ